MRLCALLLLAMLTGCGIVRPQPKTAAKPATASSPNNLPKAALGQEIRVRWQRKVPPRGIERVMEIAAKSGTLDATQESGLLNEARGVFYRENRARARFTAPTVQAVREENRVIARDGVVVHSIDPPGGTLTAHRLTWRADKQEIVAEGDVYIQFQPKDASQPSAKGGPWRRVTFDTELVKFKLP
jgi:hypothetical protein